MLIYFIEKEPISQNIMPKLFATLNYEEKKSKFLAFAYVLDGEKDNIEVLSALKKEHEEARHLLHVCRYKNKFDALVLEASDDREPISSMKKASRFFERDKISDFGIYIVRYYGGKELGASHLDHVYFTMAMKLFEQYKQKTTR